MAKFVPVVSSALVAVKYDRAQSQLTIQFGEVFYEYDDVPADVVVDFMFSDSIGSAFSTLVKKGGFAFRKITAGQAHI